MINYYHPTIEQAMYEWFVTFMQYLFWTAAVLIGFMVVGWVLYALFIFCKQATSTFFEDDD